MPSRMATSQATLHGPYMSMLPSRGSSISGGAGSWSGAVAARWPGVASSL